MARWTAAAGGVFGAALAVLALAGCGGVPDEVAADAGGPPADRVFAEAAPADGAAPADTLVGDGPPGRDGAGDGTAPDGADAGPPAADGPGDGPPPDAACGAPAQRCSDHTLQTCAGGEWSDVTTCPIHCDDTLGCIECAPSVVYCVGDVRYACTSQGHQGSVVEVCGAGLCKGGVCLPQDPCAGAGASHLGCEHWATPTPNSVLVIGTGFSFALAVVNPGQSAVTVTVTGGALSAPLTTTVPAVGQVVLTLPWVDVLVDKDVTHQSSLVAGGAYRVTSTAPVAVWQLNPREPVGSTGQSCSTLFDCLFTGGECIGNVCVDAAGTTEGSLLLPAARLGREYLAMARPTVNARTCTDASSAGLCNTNCTYDAYPGFLAVVAAKPGTTTVSVTFAGHAASGPGVPTAWNKGQTADFALSGAGDVLLLASRSPASCTGDHCTACTAGGSQTCYCDHATAYDLTGSRITATQEVAVFSGHDFARVPYWVGFGDHLEEQVPPLQAWGKRAVVQKTHEIGSRPNLYRVLSGADGNQVTFNPAVAGPVTLARGEWREVQTDQAFEVNGSGRLLLAQYMVGRAISDPNATDGDPAMVLIPPVEQFLSDYWFSAPAGYAAGANVIAPAGATVSIDGVAVGGWVGVGAGAYRAATVTLTAGRHVATGTAPFGLTVFAAAARTGLAYPAGLALGVLPP